MSAEPSCCDVASSATGLGGRRIYVHENALASLARQDPEAATLVVDTLAQIALGKALFHRIEQDGVALGAVTPETARRLGTAVDGDGAEVASRCLHAIAVKPAKGAAPPAPLLAPDERVAATCYFDRYYTFATSPEMADRMYKDSHSVAEIRRLRRRGEGYQDLVLLRGPRLVLWRRSDGEHGPLSREESTRLKSAAREKLRAELRRLLDGLGLAWRERSFIAGTCDKALEIALSQGALKSL